MEDCLQTSSLMRISSKWCFMIRKGYGGYLVSVWLNSFKKSYIYVMLKLHSFRSVLRLFWIFTVHYFQKGNVSGLVRRRRVVGGGGLMLNKLSVLEVSLRPSQAFFLSNRIYTWQLFPRFVKKSAITVFAQKGWIKLFWGTLIRIRCFSSETLYLSLKLWACNRWSLSTSCSSSHQTTNYN